MTKFDIGKEVKDAIIAVHKKRWGDDSALMDDDRLNSIVRSTIGEMEYHFLGCENEGEKAVIARMALARYVAVSSGGFGDSFKLAIGDYASLKAFFNNVSLMGEQVPKVPKPDHRGEHHGEITGEVPGHWIWQSDIQDWALICESYLPNWFSIKPRSGT